MNEDSKKSILLGTKLYEKEKQKRLTLHDQGLFKINLNFEGLGIHCMARNLNAVNAIHHYHQNTVDSPVQLAFFASEK